MFHNKQSTPELKLQVSKTSLIPITSHLKAKIKSSKAHIFNLNRSPPNPKLDSNGNTHPPMHKQHVNPHLSCEKMDSGNLHGEPGVMHFLKVGNVHHGYLSQDLKEVFGGASGSFQDYDYA